LQESYNPFSYPAFGGKKRTFVIGSHIDTSYRTL
jgi:hypothetical protein